MKNKTLAAALLFTALVACRPTKPSEKSIAPVRIDYAPTMYAPVVDTVSTPPVYGWTTQPLDERELQGPAAIRYSSSVEGPTPDTLVEAYESVPNLSRVGMHASYGNSSSSAAELFGGFGEMLIPTSEDPSQAYNFYGVVLQILAQDMGRNTYQLIEVDENGTGYLFNDWFQNAYQYTVPEFVNQLDVIPPIDQLAPEEAFPFEILPKDTLANSTYERILTGGRSTENSRRLYDGISYYINIREYLISKGIKIPENINSEFFIIAVSVIDSDVYLLIPYTIGGPENEIEAIVPLHVSHKQALTLGLARSRLTDGSYLGYRDPNSNWFRPLYFIATPEGELKVVALDLPEPVPGQ